MSVNGIDMQMVIARSPDIVRDVSAFKNKPELSQHFLAVFEKSKKAQEMSRVQKVQEAEMEIIRTDIYDNSGDGYASKSNGLDMYLEERYRFGIAMNGPPEHIIDIIV